MGNILKRIKQIANNEEITITSLEAKIGASKGVFSRALAKNTDIQSKWLICIVDNYPHYSSEWLITGRGEMLKKENTEKPNEKDNYIIELQKDKIKRLEEEVDELKKIIKSNDHRKSISTKSSKLINK